MVKYGLVKTYELQKFGMEVLLFYVHLLRIVQINHYGLEIIINGEKIVQDGLTEILDGIMIGEHHHELILLGDEIH
jgi:hypothetical protein